jgi:ADP-ribosylglycohydrolase
LARLNELWKANTRAVSWPQVPETQGQENYVLDWREPGDSLAGAQGRAGSDSAGDELDIDTVRALRNRYLGALLGLACGDALGAISQYRKAGQFTPVSDMQDGGHWQLPRGAWTDDTAMTLCVAESLLALGNCDSADQLQRFRRWKFEGHLSSTGQCIGITSAAAAAADGRAPESGGEAQALVRIGAVVLFTPSLVTQALDWAEAVVQVTHSGARVVAAGRYYAALLLAAIQGASRATLLTDAGSILRRYPHAHGAGHYGLWGLGLDRYPGDESGAARGLASEGAAESDAVSELKLVLWAIGSSQSYREGLLRLVNLGGDSDVRGALYGQLAGALCGDQGIPKNWTSGLLRRSMIEDFADQLLTAALAPLA